MDKLLCQVCAEPARDPATGRIPWALPSTVFERTGPDSGRTNAPPTCWSCMPKALEECPMLREDFALYAVAERVSAGVLANLYQPGILTEVPILSKHNVFVAWDAHRYHGCALAVAQVVELRGMIPYVPLDGPLLSGGRRGMGAGAKPWIDRLFARDGGPASRGW
jgi:hypothetical protein